MSGSLQHVGALLLVLLTLVVVVVTAGPRLRSSPIVGLVLVGLLLNVSGLNSGVTISPDFAFYILLSIVIFEASFNTGVRDFLADWRRTVALALPGVGAHDRSLGEVVGSHRASAERAAGCLGQRRYPAPEGQPSWPRGASG
jgi:NhaP-type Na+/H+ or K+/H+ antiporter